MASSASGSDGQLHDENPQPVVNGNRREDDTESSCCWCCTQGDDRFTGAWDVPKEIRFCKWCGTQIVDFREAKWPERVYEHTVTLKARVACGQVKIIVPDKEVKLDTSCAGCVTGWVWCGGYLGDVNDEKGISLCMCSWWGCVKVYKASKWEELNPPEADTTRVANSPNPRRGSNKDDAGDGGGAYVATQPTAQPRAQPESI